MAVKKGGLGKGLDSLITETQELKSSSKMPKTSVVYKLFFENIIGISSIVFIVVSI